LLLGQDSVTGFNSQLFSNSSGLDTKLHDEESIRTLLSKAFGLDIFYNHKSRPINDAAFKMKVSLASNSEMLEVLVNANPSHVIVFGDYTDKNGREYNLDNFFSNMKSRPSVLNLIPEWSKELLKKTEEDLKKMGANFILRTGMSTEITNKIVIIEYLKSILDIDNLPPEEYSRHCFTNIVENQQSMIQQYNKEYEEFTSMSDMEMNFFTFIGNEKMNADMIKIFANSISARKKVVGEMLPVEMKGRQTDIRLSLENFLKRIKEKLLDTSNEKPYTLYFYYGLMRNQRSINDPKQDHEISIETAAKYYQGAISGEFPLSTVYKLVGANDSWDRWFYGWNLTFHWDDIFKLWKEKLETEHFNSLINTFEKGDKGLLKILNPKLWEFVRKLRWVTNAARYGGELEKNMKPGTQIADANQESLDAVTCLGYKEYNEILIWNEVIRNFSKIGSDIMGGL
jgi:hypothetical protein